MREGQPRTYNRVSSAKIALLKSNARFT